MKKSIRNILLATVIAVSTYFGKGHVEPIHITNPARQEQSLDWRNPQETINKAFQLASPENISEIIYDPDFIKSDEYIRERLTGRTSSNSIENYIAETKKQSPNHNMCVVGTIDNTGDEKKRPAFARRELLICPSTNTLEDIASQITHEDAHAEEERYGYEFGDKRIRGAELTEWFNIGAIREEVILDIGELDAYATQIERINKLKKPSIVCLINTVNHLYKFSEITREGLEKGKLLPLERLYAETKMKKHEKTIKDSYK